MRKMMPGCELDPEMVCVFPHPVACSHVSAAHHITERVCTYAIGKDRRVVPVHNMPNELLGTPVVHLLLPTLLIKHPVEAEPDVLGLLTHHRHGRLDERGTAIDLWRVEYKDPVVEDLEHLAHGARRVHTG